jgi:hypothetical protein
MAEQAKETPEERALRERVEALKVRSNKLPASRQKIAELNRQEIAELKRLDEEGQEALRQIAHIREAEAWQKLSPEARARASVQAVYDWSTHKRTCQVSGDTVDIETGRGLIVVTALDRDAAVRALKPAAKIGEGGLALYDNSEPAVLQGLLKAALYPEDRGEIQRICEESFPLAAAAYSQALMLSGAFASVTSGKSSG